MRDPALEVPCRICGGALEPAFESTVLGTVPVTYHVCQRCRSLILPHPTWLDRAYGPLPGPDPDFGALTRTLFVLGTLRRMRAVGLVPRQCKALDYGAGKGVLVRHLLDRGFDAWGYEPIATPLYAEDRIVQERPGGGFDLITCIEVVEHLLDPIDTLQWIGAALTPRGVLVLTTELFDERRHDRRWHYLVPAHGQHVTLYSRDGLRRAAAQAGLVWGHSLRFFGIDFVHLITRREAGIPSWRWWGLRAFQRLGRWRERWDAFA